MTKGVVDLLRTAGITENALPAGHRVELLEELLALYRTLGLVVGDQAAALRERCELADRCWAHAKDPRPTAECGGISMPWIGPSYEIGGVGVLGLNFNDAAGLDIMWSITLGNREALAEGHRRIGAYEGYRGSDFIYRAIRSAGLVMDAVAGRDICDQEDPVELTSTLDAVIRLQGVKCSPQNPQRSRPTNEMLRSCVPFLLPHELAILRPSAVVAFGWDLSPAIEQLPGYIEEYNKSCLSVGRVSSKQATTRFFMIPHPSGSKWMSGHRELQDYLKQRPGN